MCALCGGGADGVQPFGDLPDEVDVQQVHTERRVFQDAEETQGVAALL